MSYRPSGRRMPEPPVVDLDALGADLRLICAYAAKAGLMTDDLLAASGKANEALAGPHPRDAKPVLAALSLAVRRIRPMSLADLKFGHDPFDPDNRHRAQIAQFWLAAFALILLGFLVVYMLDLQREQEALANIEQVSNLNPREKLSALRRMMQDKSPQERVALQEQRAELGRIYGRIVNSYIQSREAHQFKLSPLDGVQDLLRDLLAQLSSRDEKDQSTMPGTVAPKGDDQEDCVVGDDGDIKLPPQIQRLPSWLQAAAKDDLADYCFQIKVLAPNLQTADIGSQAREQLTFAPGIKFKASARAQWILPFLYGLLGATVYMMRNVASVRTPAMEGISMFMRVTLGGVAGIVIGWFASSNGTPFQGVSGLSLPFALAFVAGYGIDVLFLMLDRLTRLVSSPGAPSDGERST
jgi:hypothetical protein